jgi:GNAT superfamily N-acetyltransferase
VDLDVFPLSERQVDRTTLDGHWPAFMTQDPTALLFYGYIDEHYPEYALVAVDRATGAPVAKAYSAPLSFDGDVAAGLPDGGWDWAIRRCAHDRLSGTKPTIVSALEILVRPDARGGGLSALMLAAMRDNVRRLGFTDLVAPVRPSGKHAHPFQPIDESGPVVVPFALSPVQCDLAQDVAVYVEPNVWVHHRV